MIKKIWKVMPSNEIYLINGIKGLRKIRKPFLILWIDIKNKSEPLTCYDDLVRIIMIWCGRQELKQLNKSENGGFLRENGQKRLVFLILPVRSPWAKSIF